MGAVLEVAGSRAFPPESFRSPNLYVVSPFDLYPVLFNPNSMYYKFFNDPGVKKALNAPLETEWIECIPGAGRRLAETLPGQLLLAHDKPESVLPYVAELLDEAGIKVLVYNGDRDLSTVSNSARGRVLLLWSSWLFSLLCYLFV